MADSANLNVRPASQEEAGLFFAMKPEEDAVLGCIGHVRMDFGRGGRDFWHTWHPRGPEEWNTQVFKDELSTVVDALRESVLRDLNGMREYCRSHGGAIPGGWTQKEYKMLSGLDLVMMEFPEEKFIVQDLVPKGLVILSTELLATGRSLAMDMSMRIVKGEKLWKMDTKQGAVLYMIHHHALATARNLIMDMTVRIPDDLYVGVMTENSLELALTGVKSFVKDHDNVSMVVIEMGGMVEQYEDAVYVPADTLPQCIALREFALEHGIAIMVILSSDSFPVTHGKESGEDLNCVTDKADGHLDMCILNGDNTEAMLRVHTPPRDPKLWSAEYHKKNHRWEEENASDHP